MPKISHRQGKLEQTYRRLCLLAKAYDQLSEQHREGQAVIAELREARAKLAVRRPAAQMPTHDD